VQVGVIFPRGGRVAVTAEVPQATESHCATRDLPFECQGETSAPRIVYLGARMSILDRDWHAVAGASESTIEQLCRAVPCPLPASYLALLRTTNGGDGPLARQPYYVLLDSAENVADAAKGKHHEEFFPGFVVRVQRRWRVYSLGGAYARSFCGAAQIERHSDGPSAWPGSSCTECWRSQRGRSPPMGS
jgi:hypothetical protein